jgi:endonuclease YncB( thermonuclease family)
MKKPIKLLVGMLVLVSATMAWAGSKTKVVVNGTSAPVYFNDGDSFRVVAGRMSGTKGRLAGFNTLESHGPVHKWGTWTAKELYINAKMATKNGRDGSWVCNSDGSKDTYGRELFDCPSLTQSQVRKGFAHAMTITAEGSAPELQAIQHEAQKNKVGMWAHGVPDFIITSTHSIAERSGRQYAYNRIVSTKDGHSEKVQHQKAYKECEWVCVNKVAVAEDVSTKVVAELRADEILKNVLKDFSDADLAYIARMWLVIDQVALMVPLDAKEDRRKISEKLEALVTSGTLVAATTEVDSCTLFVPFKRRYGGGRATCLK